jgi:RNA polymerase sigma-70 factor, ECF subfamily
MEARDQTEAAGPEASSGTLGAVLYASKKTLVSEREWVELVRAVAAGDQLALHGLYERSHRLVFTLALRITCNLETAEEVTLDVFHDVWRRAWAYDPANGTVLGWIMNQARSRALDRLRFDNRKKRTEPDAGEPVECADSLDPRDILERKQQGRALRAALAVLTSDERQAIESAYFGGLTHAEAATRLNEPLGTVKTRIRSALNKLRQAMESGKVAT